ERYIRAPYIGGSFERQANRNGSRATTNVQHGVLGLDARHGGFDQVFSLGSRDQYIGRDAELTAMELLPSGDVLGGLALETLVQISAIVQPGHVGERFLGVGVQIRPLANQCAA